MSKDFTEVALNAVAFKQELDRFHALLTSKKSLREREIQALFKESFHLTAHIGTLVGTRRDRAGTKQREEGSEFFVDLAP